MSRDLDGLLVVTLEHAVAAPFASSRLADEGARVIKLERRGGDFARDYDKYVHGLSAYFVWLNRGKESVLFDIKDSQDIDLLHRMLSKADVFIQNMGPGATLRAGIGSETLRKRYPSLITCDISGYGSTGPYAERKAYDLLVQAEAGLALLSGSSAEPGRVGVSVCDIACGMYAHQAILQALFARTRTGQGKSISVSLFHSMADWMNVPYLQHRYGGHTPPRCGLNHPTIAPYGIYKCGDGLPILISIQNDREWATFCRSVLSQPDLLEDRRFKRNTDRVQHRDALDMEICGVFGRLRRSDVAALLQDAKIAFGQLSTLEELEKHPHARFVQVETSAGPIQMLAPPTTTPEGEQTFGGVPELGSHDDLIRTEFS